MKKKMEQHQVLLLDSYFDFMYARNILSKKRDIVTKMCYGCTVDHPSQVHHTCLMDSDEQHIDTYFEVMLEAVNEEEVLRQWSTAVDTLEDISPELLAFYKLKLYCDDWMATMKTNKWKDKMKIMTKKLLQLDRRFN